MHTRHIFSTSIVLMLLLILLISLLFELLLNFVINTRAKINNKNETQMVGRMCFRPVD